MSLRRNTPEAGGDTAFPCAHVALPAWHALFGSRRPGFRVPARRGNLLLFRNTLTDGSLDPSSLHESHPVTVVGLPAPLHAIAKQCTGNAPCFPLPADMQGVKWAATMWITGHAASAPRVM